MSFDMLNEFIKEWKSEYEKTASSDTSEEAAYAYDYYIYNFPESSKTDQAYIDTLVEYDKKLTYTNLN